MTLIPPIRLPSPYPEMDTGDWNSYQILENFTFLTANITAIRRALGGGTWSNPMTDLGDLVRGQADGLPTRIPRGTTGQRLTMVTDIPTWTDVTPPDRLATITYATAMTPDVALGNFQVITAIDSVAFTINAPSNAATGLPLTLTIRNTSGGVLGAVTWDAVYKLAAWMSPATGFSQSISFVYDGTHWVEYGRTTADVPT